ncbi:hypothetical protein [Methylorubrum suomiense]|uniref:Uncharacterized protein n=1 Tax=Methylorubrum suomiense TaxID=144191 RepID=A0ABQ4V123_9HYPH|nr:hypothetical protein [Methylorubrum suomiense]GJE78138.1 hypothetical protein BGCPKDLD_4749 [Methylorubrum suomiense]
MGTFWVFLLDPKNFLALIGLWTVIRWTIWIVRRVSRPRPQPRRKPFAETLNGKIDP